MCNSLIAKYNVAGPRYTSYPTVPYWDSDTFFLKAWKQKIIKSFKSTNASQGISLYIHLPFCESLCTFCGCHKRITKNHSVEIPYLKSILQELELYIELFGEKPIIKELHIGGGTPTFYSPENLQMLMEGLLRRVQKAKEYEFSFEGHPNNTTIEHLEVLASFGFNRVSYGVQDYNDTVQRAIHRVQPIENVIRATEDARKVGYTSISHDLIFGLPFQKKKHIRKTIEITTQLRPDRIAFYSYAHVPWMKGNGQRGFKDADLPSAEEKRAMYALGKKLLLEAGYVEIGMDHFALPSDSLYTALKNKTIHRNFMGYTNSKTDVMIGLGASAISDSWTGFAQNEKGIEAYQDLVSKGIIPVFRGHMLTDEDLIIRQHILNLMCRFETSWHTDELKNSSFPIILEQLREPETDELIFLKPDGIQVAEKGKPFIRNICMAFDLRLHREKPETQLFSMTI
ncbi:oxygen-independent coproporphyrinogen III oxidase [Rasiella sp. SM2506]|uniref:oxygen-independent coproporphyrinogen III oxidase n=1 Tax=Rasiella sp. SM2506 TaxID=3423914 RepID=UPI003D7B2847